MLEVWVWISVDRGESCVRVYDLIGVVCGEVQSFYHSGLFSISFGEDRLGAWGFSFRGSVECDDLADIGEALDHLSDAQVDTPLVQLTAQQAQDHQSQDTIEGMDSELLVRPVVGGAEGEDMGVFHTSESSFNMGLTAIGAHDFFVTPVVTVREEKGFPEKGTLKMLPFLLVKGPSKLRELVLALFEGGGKKVLHVSSS